MLFKETLDSPISMPVATAGGIALMLQKWYDLRIISVRSHSPIAT